MERTVTWQTRDGRVATVTITLDTGHDVWADGDSITVKKTELSIYAHVDGMGIIGSGRPLHVDNGPSGIVARIGDLGLTADHLAEVEAAIAAAESSPEWQAELERRERCRRESDEYEAHAEMMRRVIGTWG